MMYDGLPVIEDPTCQVAVVEDWSNVRSRGRARRRRAKHRQNIVVVSLPAWVRTDETFVMHPAIAEQLRELEVQEYMSSRLAEIIAPAAPLVRKPDDGSWWRQGSASDRLTRLREAGSLASEI